MFITPGAMLLSYSADQLHALNYSDHPPPRSVRKTIIFSLQLWLPKNRPLLRTVRRFVSFSRSEFSVGFLNVQSVSHKSTEISQTLIDSNLSVLALVETWHHSSEDLPLRCCAPPGYAIVDAPTCVRWILPVAAVASRCCSISVLPQNASSSPVQPTTFEAVRKIN